MKDDKISASEVNRYLYCHYQWYYEKVYGREYINNLYKKSGKSEKSKKINKERSKGQTKKLRRAGSRESNFARGVKFHNEYQLNTRKTGFLKTLLWVAVVLLVLLLCFYLERY